MSKLHASLLILLCLLAVPALAQQSFTIGVELQPYQPYSDVRDGVYEGYARELLDAFAEQHGYHFIYAPLPVRRLMKDFFAGELDFKYPDNPQWNATQRTARTIHYSQSTVPYIDGVMVKPERLGHSRNALHLLGTQDGFTPWPYLEDIRTGNMRLIRASQIDSLLRMAINERVEAVYLNPRVVAYHLREMKLAPDTLVFDPSLAHVQDHYYLSSVKHPKVIEEFNQFLSDQAELVQQIRQRHGL